MASSLLHDVRYTVRGLFKNPGFTALVVLPFCENAKKSGQSREDVLREKQPLPEEET